MAAALRARTDGDGAAPSPTSVAVLPFLDLSAERDQDRHRDGIAGTSSPRSRTSRVCTSAWMLSSKGRSARPVTDCGVTVQLIDVAGGHQRWSHRFDGVTAAIQGSVTLDVIGSRATG
jgi:TolB-like protein